MYDNYISELDSERFGFQVAKFSDNIENPELIVHELTKAATKLIIARVDQENIKLINRLEKIGFSYKDSQVTFSFNLQRELPKLTHNDFLLTEYENRHFPDIIEITNSSFKNYGHYFADEKLNKKKCHEIYVNWAQRCCQNHEIADNIIIAEKDNSAIGYLALKIYNTEYERYIAGVIGAVSPKYRKMGVFKAINIESIYLSAKLGCDHIEDNILVTNFPAMETYTNLSYKIIKSVITMHYWNK